jgi:hypothetical protein
VLRELAEWVHETSLSAATRCNPHAPDSRNAAIEKAAHFLPRERSTIAPGLPG